MTFPRIIMSRRLRPKSSQGTGQLEELMSPCPFDTGKQFETTNHTDTTQETNEDDHDFEESDFDGFESPGNNDRLETSFVEDLSMNDIRGSRRSQRMKLLHAMFSSFNLSHQKNSLRRNQNNNDNSNSARRSLKRVQFSKSVSVKELEISGEEAKERWYEDTQSIAMKKDVMRTLENIILCKAANKEFAENDHQTAWGIRFTDKDEIIERKLYKISSRFVVFDEQEEQRISQTKDHDRLRRVYQQASLRSSALAREAGKKWENEVKILNGYKD